METITFSQDQNTGQYTYTFLSDGTRRIFQLTQADGVQGVFISSRLSSSAPWAEVSRVAPLTASRNLLFAVDIDDGVYVRLSSSSPISLALMSTIQPSA